ncbi:MAG: NAD(P)H-dependent oxidoreductase [Polyangiaceae bacterium]|nr:NAD(P)H-dependent oxidoreductase [Polyangiaceae bacterium]
MRVLIVHAHPEPLSFNGAMTRRAVETLEAEGHAVTVSDLYAMGFEPVVTRADFLERKREDYFHVQTEQRHAHEGGGFAPDLAAEMEKLAAADALIFQFPLWWFGLPAILKGWVDRVLAVGFAYGGGRGYSNGAFRGKRAMCAVTTGGGPAMFSPEGLAGDVMQLLYPVHHGMFYFVGMDALPPFIAYGAARVTPEQRAAYLDAYADRLRALFTAEPIRYPPLEAYDERLVLRRAPAGDGG